MFFFKRKSNEDVEKGRKRERREGIEDVQPMVQENVGNEEGRLYGYEGYQWQGEPGETAYTQGYSYTQYQAYDQYGLYNSYQDGYSQYYQYQDYQQYIAPLQHYAYLEDRAPTGIQFLDSYLGGGLKRGEVYLIAGEAGTGKTIFSLTFLKTGAEYYNEVGMYISVDEPSEDVKMGVREALGWDLDSLERSGRLIMMDFKTYFRIYAREERLTIDPRDLAKVIIEHVKKYDVRRLVIDPIAPLVIMSHQDVIWVREYLRELVFQLKRLKDVTTILTSEIPTGEESKLSRFGVEEYLAGGVIMLSLKELNLGDSLPCLARIMFIRKMRWMPVRPIKLIYEIMSPYGIFVIGPLNDQNTIEYYRRYFCLGESRS